MVSDRRSLEDSRAVLGVRTPGFWDAAAAPGAPVRGVWANPLPSPTLALSQGTLTLAVFLRVPLCHFTVILSPDVWQGTRWGLQTGEGLQGLPGKLGLKTQQASITH